MIDLILFLFVVGVFAAGFWIGKTFGSIKEAATRGKAWVASFFG